MTYTKECPTCKREIVFSHDSSRNYSIKNNLSCFSCGKRAGAKKNRKRPYEWYLSKIVASAKAYHKIFSLTYDDMVEFTKTKQCHYCSDTIPWLEYSPPRKNRRGGYYLDRKDNSLGYTKDNCVVCCSFCNKMKKDIVSYRIMVRIGKILKEERENV